MHCLNIFYQTSGQKINSQTTHLFSKNVDYHLYEDILQHTGFSHVTRTGKYLGANIAIGRSTKGHLITLLKKSSKDSVDGNNNVLA